MNNIDILKKLLTPYDVGHTKIRIGPQHDGGYVVSKTLLAKTDAVYSLGVGTECGFDLELAQAGLPIYMFESSHPSPPLTHPNFFYTQAFVNSEVLERAVISNSHISSNLLLAMDIEGGEYSLLSAISDEFLFKFKQISFEVHDVLNNPSLISILEKLNNHYILIHIHANNNCIRPGAFSSGIVDGVPNVLELTYVHRSEVSNDPTISSVGSPIKDLDFKNQQDLPDVELNWWL